MRKTENYGFLLPDPEDFIKIEDITQNFEKIDAEIKKAAEAVEGIDISEQLKGYYTKKQTDEAISNAIEENIIAVLGGSY